MSTIKSLDITVRSKTLFFEVKMPILLDTQDWKKGSEKILLKLQKLRHVSAKIFSLH